MMSALPPALAISIAPSVPIATTTIDDVVLPGRTLMFDVVGTAPWSGYSLMNVVAVALTTVRFRTIAVAPVGMPKAPVTCHTSVPAPEKCIDESLRLSSARTGLIGVNALATPVASATQA
jgi:hypothetical protein